MNKILSILAVWLCSVAAFAQLNTEDDWGLPGNPGVVTKKISVDVNNADFGSAKVTTATTYGTGIYPVGSKVALQATPSTGYHFVKWTVGEAELAATASYQFTMPDEDVTVTAHFAANRYTVKFISDGQEIKSDTLDYGAAITAPANPSKEGYTFKKWDKDVAATVPASDVTYTAVYEVNKYDVTFTIDNVEFSKSSMNYGASIVAPAAPAKTGYTFGGWTPDATVPSHDVTYDATYLINQYNVSFIADGKTVKSGKQDYASAITAPEDPLKEGYTFRGWTPDVAATVPANDVTYTAVFDVNKYSVVFTVEGEEYSRTTLEYGSAITAPAAPVKTGYSFSGWTPDDKVPAHDVSYDGTFSINSYKVIFDADNGTDSIMNILKYGSAITAPADPVKTGYTFNGWTPAVDGATVPAGDIRFKANWKVNSYKLSFVVDGVVTESKVDFGSAIVTPTTPVKEGYVFDAWTPAVAETMPAEDVTYTATWKLGRFNVKFIADGKTIYSESQEYGSAITAPADPSKTGYNFIGWNPAVDATVPAHDVTYIASFGKGAFLVKFVVDGKDYQTTSMDFGETIVLPENNPTKTGYTFAGWNGYEEGATVPADGVTYEALWTLDKYKVTFDVDGNLDEKTLDYGSAIIAPADPTKAGYTFDGWSPAVAESVPASDVTYTATWKVNKYKFTLKADDKVFFTTEVEYNTAIPVIASRPEKEGYTFAGWDGESEYELMPADSLTFNAKWVANRYAVTFTTEKDTVKSELMDYGTAIVAPEAPAKEGYSFTGWTPAVAATVPANDVTYTASYRINQYNVVFVVGNDTVKAETLDYGSSVSTPVVPVREGYTFGGWSPEVAATMPASDVSYTATWIINRYKVTFVDNDGVTVFKADTLEYGSAISSPVSPVKTGYTFIGWTPEVEASVPAGDLTYTAKWSINKYVVTFMSDGAVVKTDTLDYYSSVTVPENPVKTGYSFDGWTPEVADVVYAEDVTYTAKWTVNRYYVYFVVDNDTVLTSQVEYGSAISVPENPVKSGFEFAGWTPELAESMPAEDVTYVATWSEVNSIESVRRNNEDNVFHTLSGVKVNTPVKGRIYIVNGVKRIYR